MLCLPGVACWCIFFGFVFQSFIPPQIRMNLRILQPFAGTGMIACWGLAIVSIGIYWRKQRTWYVLINLLVNGTGLTFTVVVVGVLVLAVLADNVWLD